MTVTARADALNAHVEVVLSGLLALHDTATEWAGDLDGLALLLKAHDTIKTDLALVHGEIQRLLLPLVPGQEVVQGVGALVRSGGGKRKNWDGRLLVGLIAAQEADRRFDEVEPPGALAHRVGQALMVCGALDNASANWRAGELKKRGIDPNDFATYEPGNVTVRLVST